MKKKPWQAIPETETPLLCDKPFQHEYIAEALCTKPLGHLDECGWGERYPAVGGKP